MFNPNNGNMTVCLENDDILETPMPISRVRCKPYADGQPNSLLAATYASGHLRLWNFGNGHCISQVQANSCNQNWQCDL